MPSVVSFPLVLKEGYCYLTRGYNGRQTVMGPLVPYDGDEVAGCCWQDPAGYPLAWTKHGRWCNNSSGADVLDLVDELKEQQLQLL